MNNYQGIIIEESLSDKEVLKEIKIISTKIEKVQEKHQAPWLLQWILDTVEIEESQADGVANRLSKVIDQRHGWFIDYQNDK